MNDPWSADERTLPGRLQVLFDAMAVGVVVTDERGRARFANRHAVRLIGRRVDDGVAGIMEAIDPADRPRLRMALDDAFGSGATTAWRHRLGSTDGEEIWVDHTVTALLAPSGVVVGVLSTFADVTAEHEVEQALEGSRDFTSAVLDTVGAFVVVTDAEGRILRLNASFAELGIDPRAAVGATITDPDVVPVEYQEVVRAALAATLLDELRPVEIELSLPGGNRRRIVWNTDTHRDPDGRVRTVIATGIDVTELRQLEEQLSQRERLDSIGRLTAGVAHDFGNTLAVVQMRAERLRDRGDPASAADLDAIGRTVDHARGLIADLLAFSRGHSPPAAPIAADEVVRRTVSEVRDVMRPGVRLGMALHAAGALVSIDAVGLQRALTNIAINANDAMPNGGFLSFRTCIVRANSPARATDPATGQPFHGDQVEIVVGDTGVGIPRHQRARVFEPYFTTKPPSRGTGLGLATAYGTVVQAGGAIHVESELGVGTTFRIRLPVAVAVSAPDEPRSARVMVVDDDDELRAVMAEVLRDLGFDVVSAGDPATALGLVTDDLMGLVSDMCLPGRGGGELAIDIAGLVPGLRVLFVSAGTDGSPPTLLVEGAALLRKPFSAAQFRVAVEEHLRTAPP